MSAAAAALRFVLIAIIVATLTAALFVLGSAIEVATTGRQLVGFFPVVVIFAFIYAFLGMLIFGLPTLKALRDFNCNKRPRHFVVAGAVAGTCAAGLLNFLFFSPDPAFALTTLKFIAPLGAVGGGTAGILWWWLVERHQFG